MSGPRRLAVFLSALWIAAWLLMYYADIRDGFNLGGFLALGVGPVALAWGVWWVVAGFRRNAGPEA